MCTHFMVYLWYTFCRHEILVGTPTMFSVMCRLQKMKSIRWCFPERSLISLTNKKRLSWLTKVTTFVWYPTIVTDNLCYSNKWKPFAPPPNACSGSATACLVRVCAAVENVMLFSLYKIFVTSCSTPTNHSHEPPLGWRCRARSAVWNRFPIDDLLVLHTEISIVTVNDSQS